MINAFNDEKDMLEHVREVSRKRSAMDMKMLIRAVMEMPITDGKVYTLDDVGSMAELSKLNTDVRTRILLNVSRSAASGDIKAADFLFKYAGYTPAIETNVSVNLPQIINDLAPPEDDLIDVTPPKEHVQISAPEDDKFIKTVVGAALSATEEDDDTECAPDGNPLVLDISKVRFADG